MNNLELSLRVNPGRLKLVILYAESSIGAYTFKFCGTFAKLL